MLTRFNFPVIFLVTSIIVSTFISIYAWKHPRMRDTRSFTIACLTSILWMIGDVIGRLGDTFAVQWIGEIVRFVGVVALPVALLVFIYRYCGKRISRRNILWLSVVPIISWLVLLSNSWHRLFFSQMQIGESNSMKVEFGYYFWFVHLPYSYILMLIGFVTVIFEANRAARHNRKQIFILLFSLCIPFSVNVIGVFKLLGEFSYTSLSFPAFFMVMAIAIFRYRFLFSNPIAYEAVFQNIRDGVVILDRDNTIMDINPVAAKSLDKMPREIIGQKFEKAFAQFNDILDKYLDAANLNDEIEVDLAGSQRCISVSITPLENSDGTLNGRIFTLRDITDTKQHQLSLETLAFHDPLTRVANRRKFQEEVEIAVEKARETNGKFTVLYFDLNDFKVVNDTFGHETGDEFLRYIAARVASVLRKPDLLARLGGDEFAALLHDCDAAGMEIVINRILENVQRPFQIGEHTLVADLSVGAAYFPADGANLNELMRRADAAMYRAKQQNRIPLLSNNQFDVSENANGYIS